MTRPLLWAVPLALLASVALAADPVHHAIEHLLDGLRFVVDGDDDREPMRHRVRF